MSDIKNGGPAFPREHNAVSEGMSLRDYFAAKAMQAFVSRWAGHDSYNEGGISFARVSQHAYELADAMLAARSKA